MDANELSRSDQPLVVSYGMGLDSTGMLVEMEARGIVPDAIVFADTGAEKPETYAYLDVMNEWLDKVGFPRITVVSYAPVRAPYTTLEGKCLANDTLPSIAFSSGHSCALVFKRDVQVKWLKSWGPALDAIAAGGRVVKAIGYDSSPADLRRSTKANAGTEKIRAKIAERVAEGRKALADQWEADNVDFWYPLQQWGLERDALAKLITDAGLPLPVKSACYFCPASGLGEVLDLKRDHRDLYDRAVAMEQGHLTGKHAVPDRAKGAIGTGLGMTWAWGWIAEAETVEEAREIIAAHGGKVGKKLRP